ncbi:hypothetical protein CYMTET_19789 [Cymbomonas tetramitiformis]|uniref:RING-type domain-containing protein n=1 Tax=Cymbomonas tetramitiformis TaxID=36881 RepID=A0AAE0G5A8_9CHLO|nr:hypothetical protein CYMTET_19789 [Cymbomonas tetramitiformis]
MAEETERTSSILFFNQKLHSKAKPSTRSSRHPRASPALCRSAPFDSVQPQPSGSDHLQLQASQAQSCETDRNCTKVDMPVEAPQAVRHNSLPPLSKDKDLHSFLCSVCQHQLRGFTMMCGHTVTCDSCAHLLAANNAACPVCAAPIAFTSSAAGMPELSHTFAEIGVSLAPSNNAPALIHALPSHGHTAPRAAASLARPASADPQRGERSWEAPQRQASGRASAKAIRAQQDRRRHLADIEGGGGISGLSAVERRRALEVIKALLIVPMPCATYAALCAEGEVHKMSTEERRLALQEIAASQTRTEAANVKRLLPS